MGEIAGMLSRLTKEWGVIGQAPTSFLFCSAVIAAAIWYVARYLQKFQLESLREQLKTADARNQLLKEQIEEYRERLGLSDKTKTAYSSLSHQELKTSALTLAKDLRAFEKKTNAENAALMHQCSNRFRSAKGEAEKDRVWRSDANTMSRQFLEHQARFGPLRAESKCISDEILKRVPEQPDSQSTRWARVALEDGLSGSQPALNLADYLESIALLLPK